MEVLGVLTLIFILLLPIILLLLKKQTLDSLPPGPPKLPLIGNLHQLASRTTLPHHRLAELAAVYGPIMHLRLGEVPTVVISSAEMAKEVMKTHDILLCNRPKLIMPQVMFYNCTDIGFAPYGEYWRQLRKIATLELFTAHHVQMFRPIREAEVLDIVKALASQAGSVVNLSNMIFALMFDITLRVAMDKKSNDVEDFKSLIADMTEICSGFSISDLYPSLKFINTISGMKRKLQGLVQRFDRIMDPIIDEHISNRKCRQVQEEQDLVDVLLEYHKDNKHLGTTFSLDTNNVKAIIFELLGAASETSSTTIEWAISELLKNPQEMRRAQEEIRRVLKEEEILINEESLEKLKYLKLIVKETLRLHPPFPCLIPRESMEKCEIDGYTIPSKTRIFINAWAIGRDPKYWKDPEIFNPRRFEGSLVDYKGMHFELIPFGAGRRMCPGMKLATVTIELVLAMLLYHFDWKLANETTPENLNMNETFGIVGRRKDDLQVTPLIHCSSCFK